MKKERFKKILGSLVTTTLLALIVMSCSNEEADQSAEAQNNDTEDMEILAEIQSMTEVLDDMSEVITIEVDANLGFKETTAKSLPEGPYFSSCLSRTVVTDGNNINISLDFGSGCEGPHGNILAGLVRIDVQLIADGEQLITHSFENFSINGRTVEGSISKNRIRANDDGYPQALISRDISIQWNENTAFNRVGQTRRVWVSGSDTNTWGDDVFVTTGSWKVFKNGVLQRSVAISNELRREMSCRFLVSGTLDIEGAASFSLDFGDGTCDDIAVVESGDWEREIQLGRLRWLLRQ